MNDTLKNILKILNNSKFAKFKEHMKIFGSITTDKPEPNDIDIMLDYSEFKGSVHEPNSIPDINIFLSLARKYYGYVDVFVRVGKKLYVRDDTASGWIIAKKSKQIWNDSVKYGKTLDKVLSERDSVSF
jgi:hypothetical protein